MILESLIACTIVYYTLIFMFIALGEYEKKSSILIDIFIPFAGIARIVLIRLKELD